MSPVAIVTGGSAGLGLVIAQTFLKQGYRVVISGRDESRLDGAKIRLENEDRLRSIAGDLTRSSDANQLIEFTISEFGRLDVLVNCIGISDRGLVENVTSERLSDLIAQNVTTTLNCSSAAIAHLESTRGVIVNIGSLASKVGARYLGGYSIAKHALAGLTQQMRLELRPRGIHVALVSPGPIRRNDAGHRYESRMDSTVPSAASSPGAGAKLRGIAPEKVAAAVLSCAVRRHPDIVLPGYLRILIALGHISPRFGDWLLLKFTSSNQKDS